MGQREFDRMMSVWRDVATTCHVGAKLFALSTVIIFAHVIPALSAESARGLEVLRTVFFCGDRASPRPPRDRPIRAQLVAGDKMPIAYFLDRVPDDDLLSMPSSATDIVVASVCSKHQAIWVAGIGRGSGRKICRGIFYLRVSRSATFGKATLQSVRYLTSDSDYAATSEGSSILIRRINSVGNTRW
jgi:hypothetical protein